MAHAEPDWNLPEPEPTHERRCFHHRASVLEGDSLTCPIEGRPSHRRMDHGWRDSPKAWCLFHIASNRLTAVIIGEYVKWEPWCAGPDTEPPEPRRNEHGNLSIPRREKRERKMKLRLKSGEMSHAEWIRRLRVRIMQGLE